MNFRSALFIWSLATCSIITSCTTSKLYLTNNKQSGIFKEAKADSIRHYLAQISGEQIQDTVFIKYEFDNETCWNVLDGQSDQYISNVIESRNAYVSRYQNDHPNVTILSIKEVGKNFNKLVMRNPKITVDQGGFLRQYIFLNNAKCGTSMKLFPNGRYECYLSDAHFGILNSK